MPKPTEISHYPTELFDVIHAISARQKVTLTFPRRKDAEAARLDFYGFKNALKRTQNVDLINAAGQVRVRIIQRDDSKWDCVFHHADDTFVGIALREALKDLNIPRPATSIATSSSSSPSSADRSFIPQTTSDPTDDVLARRLRTGQCSECHPGLPCWGPGTPCVRA